MWAHRDLERDVDVWLFRLSLLLLKIATLSLILGEPANLLTGECLAVDDVVDTSESDDEDEDCWNVETIVS